MMIARLCCIPEQARVQKTDGRHGDKIRSLNSELYFEVTRLMMATNPERQTEAF